MEYFPARQVNAAIAGRDEIVHVCAGETEGFVFGERNPGVMSQLLAALVIHGFVCGDKYFKIHATGFQQSFSNFCQADLSKVF
ncbi:MAG: hypothetical protein M0C28_36460 [Candidatus Moduliflexus flocculans]|nr:hypothetical protein [Candidatus Moduliflexus flocculans]